MPELEDWVLIDSLQDAIALLPFFPFKTLVTSVACKHVCVHPSKDEILFMSFLLSHAKGHLIAFPKNLWVNSPQTVVLERKSYLQNLFMNLHDCEYQNAA